ncbi:MAG: ribonuclease E/G [Rhizobiales bacterium]|nr:ribonuclease E/G [Hyphomicrobiales bacterium]
MHKIKHGLFEVHNLAEQVAELYERQVALDNGGNFIIEQTTAMTVVDVNSGQYIGSDPAKMVDIINIAAADKICKQLSLRKISGLVVIDFLKYAKKAERLKFSEYLLKLAKVYKFELGSLTNFGLAEFKISRTTKNIDEKILDMT